MSAKTYKWTIEVEVAAAWVADGFDLTAERAHDIFTRALPYAYGHEVACRVVAAPDAREIRREQGYPESAIGAPCSCGKYGCHDVRCAANRKGVRS